MTDTLSDCLTGFEVRDATEIAHILPHATKKEPALWLFARIIGLAPWNTSAAVKEHKESLKNLALLPKSVHKRMGGGSGEAMLRPEREALEQTIYAIEAFLTDQEANTTMADFPQIGKWRWDFVAMNRYRADLQPRCGDLPMFTYQPMWLPTKEDKCIRGQGYQFRSPDGQSGDELTKAVFLPDSDTPANLRCGSRCAIRADGDRLLPLCELVFQTNVG